MRAPVSATAELLGSARNLLCLLAAALALACMLPASAAALQFVQAPSSPYGFGSEDAAELVTGDLDGDGRDDVVTANHGPLAAGEPSYSVLLATPDGSLALTGAGAEALPGYAGGIALGDFDADDVLDLAVALQAGGASVYLGDGNGGFGASPAAVLATGNNPSAIAAADLDGDGNDDLAVANFESDDVSVYYGVGDGTFVEAEASPFPVGAEEPLGLAVGDFDGDGLGDIATANRDATGINERSMSVLLAGDDGNYAAAPGPLFGEYRSQDIGVGHVDAGPTLDLVTVSSPNNGIVVKLGNGDGTFTDAPGGPFDFPSRTTASLALADLNGDGRDDVSLPIGGSIGETADDSVWVFESAADGSLSTPEGNPLSVWPAASPDSIAAGDFDGDGTPDLVTENFSENLTVLLRSDDPQPKPALAPEALGFGEHLVGEISEPQDVLVINEGAGPLALSSLSLGGEAPDQFELDTSACDPQLDQGEVCTAEVRFAPTRSGWLRASLQIPRPLGPPVQVFLEGEAEDVASATISPTEKDFGSLEVWEGPTDVEIFDVENTSEVWIEIESVSIEGANPDDFEIEYDGCEGEDLYEEGEECEIDVSFNPQAVGERSAELTIVSSDLAAPLTASLSGTGEANPGIWASPETWDAGAAPVGTGEGPTEWFTVYSEGTTPLEIGTVTLAGVSPGDFEIVEDECSGESVEPFMECEIEVEFSPGSVGPKAALLEIPSNVPGSPTTVTLEGSGEPNPAAALTPTSHDFGPVPFKTQSTSKAFTLESTGTTPVYVGSAGLTNTVDGFEFVANACDGVTLDPGETCQVEVALKPQILAPVSGELGFSTDAPGAAPTATLTGLGASNPDISITPTSHDFGDRLLGSGPSATQTFTVESTGSTDVNLGTIELTGTDPAEFELAEDCPATLAPTATCQIQVSFDPASEGPKSAQLSVASDAPGSPTTASLSGTGVAPQPRLEIAPGSHDFGGVAVGDESSGQPFTLESSGNVAVTISSLQIGGADGDEFRYYDENCFNVTLQPSETCEVEVGFAPESIGAKEAEVRISSDATASPTTASLDGEGLANAGIAVAPESVAFGEAVVGDDMLEALPVTIESNGTTPLEIGAVTLSGAGRDQFSVSDEGCEVAIAPGETCGLTVLFNPTSAGVHEATLEIPSNAAGPPLTVPLSGTGVAKPEPPQPPEPPKPPTPEQPRQPACLEPQVGQPGVFAPDVKGDPGAPGVRARFAIDGPTVLEVSGQVRYRPNGKVRAAALETRALEATGNRANYKVALPARLREKLRPGTAVTLKLRYRSRKAETACTAFGPWKRKSIATKVVWVEN